MSYLKWDQSLSVNDDVMDEQHQLLFDYVNEFYEAIKKHEDNHQLLQIMEKVLAYTKFHFAEEEELMDAYEYPGAELHKKIHQNLIKSVKDFMLSLTLGENVTREIKHFLKQCLVSHI